MGFSHAIYLFLLKTLIALFSEVKRSEQYQLQLVDYVGLYYVIY